jgi:protein-S-isoprenylcysteine O-methyltransferase Ste14
MLRRIVQLLLANIITGVVLFAAAGTVHWRRGWIYIGLHMAMVAASGILIVRTNPSVIAARGRIHREAKAFDKVILRIYMLLLPATVVVAGLDAVRYRWAPLPVATIYAGVPLAVLAIVPALWVLMVNPFAEAAVRIQKERGHVVITRGPYRFVRHPMYVGVILTGFAAPLILGSGWAFVPAVATLILFVVRTALEDKTLRTELPGYAEFAEHTRYRLVPGIW